jgi:hypothetical protein
MAAALDRPIARVVAVGVFLACGGLLAFLNRDAFLPGAEAEDPLAICIAERTGHVEAMLADGTIDERQAGLFRSRAQAMCHAELGEGGPPLPP